MPIHGILKSKPKLRITLMLFIGINLFDERYTKREFLKIET